MARTTSATGSGRNKSGRRNTLIWIGVATLIVIGLIWKEQVALLYILATLSVTALLVVVAMADLQGARQLQTSPAPHDDSAAAGDGLSASGVASERTAKRR
jgi:hypothetical protein